MKNRALTPEQLNEFNDLAHERAMAIANLLDKGVQPYVAIEALLRVLRGTSTLLPPEALSHLSFVLAQFAGDLMRQKISAPPKTTTH